MSAPTHLRATPSSAPHDVPSQLTGFGTLVRLILRRDRVRLSIWVGAIAGFTVLFAAVLPGVYADEFERQSRATLIENPGLRAFTGPGYGLDDYTFGAMLAQEYLSWTAIFVALMAFLLVVRYTRAEEEAGRSELVRAAVIGRRAQTAAAVTVVIGASLLVGALIALGLSPLGMESITVASSWLFGAALASIGVVFAAVAAVTAQSTEHSRGAAGLAGALFALVYLVRGAGDMSAIGGGVLSWFSPLGWAQQTRVYVDDRWWPLLLSGVLTVALIATAFWLSTRRDVGAGLRRPRPGRPSAPRWLAGSFGLAVRLHRTSVMWWSFGLFLFGLGYGSLMGEVERFISELSAIDEWMAAIGGPTIVDSFISVLVLMVAVVVAVFAVLAVARLHSEETARRVEPLLATATSRQRWAASHLIVPFAGSAVLTLFAGFGLGISSSAALNDPDMLPVVLGAALAYLPAVWLTAAVGVALFGLLPTAGALVWFLVAYATVIVIFAGLLGLPDWMINISPFGHVPAVPAVELQWAPLLVLTAIAATLVTAGLIGFRRRDLDTV